MSKKFDFQLNLRGLNELMRGPEMQSILEERGQAIAEEATRASGGGEFEVETKPLNWIAVCNVRATDQKAVQSCLKDDTLLKSEYAGYSKGHK